MENTTEVWDILDVENTITNTSNTTGKISSNNNGDLLYSSNAMYLTDYELYNIGERMYPYHTFLFIIPGMIGNLIALIVISQPSMRGMSSSIYVMTLSIADNIALLGFLLGMISLIYHNEIISDGFCTAYSIILSGGSMISAWTVVAMSFERVLIVTFPLKAPAWTSRRKAVIIVAVITLFILLHNIHFFWTSMESKAMPVCEYDYERYNSFLGTWSIYDACMASYIPLCLIVVMNVIIITMMAKARKIQKKMSNAPTSQSTQNGSGGVKAKSTSNATNQVTIMLLSVSIAFFICMTPYGIFQIFVNEIIDFTKITVGEYARLTFVNQFCLIFWELNHSINIILYSLTGRKFRMTLMKTLSCGKYEHRSRSATYASETARTTNINRANGVTKATSVTTVSEAV